MNNVIYIDMEKERNKETKKEKKLIITESEQKNMSMIENHGSNFGHS